VAIIGTFIAFVLHVFIFALRYNNTTTSRISNADDGKYVVSEGTFGLGRGRPASFFGRSQGKTRGDYFRVSFVFSQKK